MWPTTPKIAENSTKIAPPFQPHQSYTNEAIPKSPSFAKLFFFLLFSSSYVLSMRKTCVTLSTVTKLEGLVQKCLKSPGVHCGELRRAIEEGAAKFPNDDAQRVMAATARLRWVNSASQVALYSRLSAICTQKPSPGRIVKLLQLSADCRLTDQPSVDTFLTKSVIKKMTAPQAQKTLTALSRMSGKTSVERLLLEKAMSEECLFSLIEVLRYCTQNGGRLRHIMKGVVARTQKLLEEGREVNASSLATFGWCCAKMRFVSAAPVFTRRSLASVAAGATKGPNTTFTLVALATFPHNPDPTSIRLVAGLAELLLEDAKNKPTEITLSKGLWALSTLKFQDNSVYLGLARRCVDIAGSFSATSLVHVVWALQRGGVSLVYPLTRLCDRLEVLAKRLKGQEILMLLQSAASSRADVVCGKGLLIQAGSLLADVEKLRELDASSLPSIATTLIALDLPLKSVFHTLLEEVLHRKLVFDGVSTSFLLWAVVKARVSDDSITPRCFAWLTTEMLKKSPEGSALQLSLWAHAKMRLKGDYLEDLLHRTWSNLEGFEAKHVASLVWSSSKLRGVSYDQGEAGLRRLQILQQNGNDVEVRHIASVTTASVAMRFTGDTPLCRVLLEVCSESLSRGDAWSVAATVDIVTQLAIAKVLTKEVLVKALDGMDAQDINEMTPLQLASLLWACTAMGYVPETFQERSCARARFYLNDIEFSSAEAKVARAYLKRFGGEEE